jgi:hypothetical protein
MIDVPGMPPKNSKTKRVSPQDATLFWHETFTFKIECNDLSSAQLRIRCFSLPAVLYCLHSPACLRDVLSMLAYGGSSIYEKHARWI